MTSKVALAMLFAKLSRLEIFCQFRMVARLEIADIPKMPEHHRRRQDHSGRVRSVSAHDVVRDVATSRFEKRVFLYMVRMYK